MLPNLSVLWVIFFVLLLTVVVDRMLLKPVLAVIKKREEAIDSARDLARRSATEAQAATAEFERKTAAARAEMYREMDDMRRAALNRRADVAIGAPARAMAQEPAQPKAAAHETEAGKQVSGEHEAEEGEHDAGWMPVIAKATNFAILAGVLIYFLRSTVTGYLNGRIAKV